MDVSKLKTGDKIVYSDGRDGHVNVIADILEITDKGMTVKFEDRARPTYIAFTERAWMDHLSAK